MFNQLAQGGGVAAPERMKLQMGMKRAAFNQQQPRMAPIRPGIPRPGQPSPVPMQMPSPQQFGVNQPADRMGQMQAQMQAGQDQFRAGQMQDQLQAARPAPGPVAPPQRPQQPKPQKPGITPPPQRGIPHPGKGQPQRPEYTSPGFADGPAQGMDMDLKQRRFIQEALNQNFAPQEIFQFLQQTVWNG